MRTLEGPGESPAELTSQAQRTATVNESGLYRTVWRWHFYAGLFAIPVLVVLCLSGITWLFRPQLNGLLYRHLLHVAPGVHALSYDVQLSRVKDAYPGATITALGTPVSPTSSTRFDLKTQDGRGYSVYVDPYRGSVLGRRDNDRDPAQIALALHGSLLSARFLGSERWGDRLIEVVASWTILLLGTGIFLWWPRGSRRTSLEGVLVPRTKRRGSRTFWRDLHAVTGVLFAFVSLFFLITGLFWTGFWGDNFKKVAGHYGNVNWPPETFAGGVPSTSVGDLPRTGKADWAMSDLPVPPSAPGGVGHAGHGAAGVVLWDPTKAAPLDAVMAQAQRLGFPPGFGVSFPSGAKGSYTVSNWPDTEENPFQHSSVSQVAFIDQYTAQPLAHMHEGDLGPVSKTTSLGIALHEGRQFGFWNQVASLTGALAILVSCATSIVMWRKRRPAGLGAPRRAANRRVVVPVIGLAAVLGTALPLLGLTLLAAMILEFLVVRRVPRLARAFGAY